MAQCGREVCLSSKACEPDSWTGTTALPRRGSRTTPRVPTLAPKQRHDAGSEGKVREKKMSEQVATISAPRCHRRAPYLHHAVLATAGDPSLRSVPRQRVQHRLLRNRNLLRQIDEHDDVGDGSTKIIFFFFCAKIAREIIEKDAVVPAPNFAHVKPIQGVGYMLVTPRQSSHAMVKGSPTPRTNKRLKISQIGHVAASSHFSLLLSSVATNAAKALQHFIDLRTQGRVTRSGSSNGRGHPSTL